MTRTTYKLSNNGLVQIDKARQLKGWNKTSKVWVEESMSSESTLKRFLKGEAISGELFINLCKAVGIEKWQELVDWQDNDSTRANFTENIKTSDSPNNQYTLTVSGIFTEVKKRQIEGLLEVLEELLLESKVVIKPPELKKPTD